MLAHERVFILTFIHSVTLPCSLGVVLLPTCHLASVLTALTCCFLLCSNAILPQGEAVSGLDLHDGTNNTNSSTYSTILYTDKAAEIISEHARR